MVLLSACALCSALALNPSPTPSPTPLPEIAHVYTSERSDSTLQNTARTTYTITRAEIERYGYQTVAQALQDVPALTMSPLGPIGSSADFSLRGSSSAQTLVLIDGMPAPGSFANSVELANLPASDVDRIEVVEGGGSTLYGTGAIGGIINVITQRKAAPALTMRAGSFDQNQLIIATPNLQYDRIVADNTFPLPDGTTRGDVDYASTALHGGIDGTFGAFNAALRAGIETHRLGVPGPLAFLTPSQRENDQNKNVDLTVTHRSAQALTTLEAGATAQTIAYFCDAVNDPACFQPDVALSRDSRVMLDLRNAVHGSRNQLLYGIDLSRGNVRADDGYGDIVVSPMAQAAAYAEDHVSTRWGTAYAGVRAERDGALGGEMSPAAGAVLRIAPDVSLKFNAATAFRAPNASELFFPNYGNPSLHPERAQVADATLVTASSLGEVSVGWFHNRTRNLIVAEPVAPLGPSCRIDPAGSMFEACNVDHALIQGVTLTWRSRPVHGLTTRLALTDLYRAQDLDAQTRLANDPVFSASLRLDYASRADGAFVRAFGVAARSQGERAPVNADRALFDQAAAFTTVDAYVTFNGGRRTDISVRGMNLGNERYAAVTGFPLPGRSYLVELSIK